MVLWFRLISYMQDNSPAAVSGLAHFKCLTGICQWENRACYRFELLRFDQLRNLLQVFGGSASCTQHCDLLCFSSILCEPPGNRHKDTAGAKHLKRTFRYIPSYSINDNIHIMDNRFKTCLRIVNYILCTQGTSKFNVAS